MDSKQHKLLVTKYGGWIEQTNDGGIARFPTVHSKEQFQNECARLERSDEMTFDAAMHDYCIAAGYTKHLDGLRVTSVDDLLRLAQDQIERLIKAPPSTVIMNRAMALKTFVHKWHAHADLLKPPVLPDACQRCRFYLRGKDDIDPDESGEYGLCRRNPPQVVALGTVYETAFPVMSINGWCGEFAK